MARFSLLFWISLSLFTIHQIVEHWWSIPWVHAYLDDILAPAIVLGFALFFFQTIFPADPQFTLHWSWILVFVIWYALLFEWYFPSKDARHYADIYDVLAYLSGAVLFFYFGNKPLAQKGV